MTAKSRKFPLPLSSLKDKSSNRSNKVVSSVLTIETPQTATQNVREFEVSNAIKVEEKTTKGGVGGVSETISTQPVKLPQVKGDFEQISEVQADARPKKISTPPGFEGPRRAMIARLEKQGIKDADVLAAMSAVPRHQFVESGLVGQAYIDVPLPIGCQQTISQPYIVALMIEVMRNGRKLQNVLEIGTGCGYQAAVLAQISENVYSIERIKLLHELAKNNLRSLRIANLRLHYGDGMVGLPQAAPFDGIILAAAGLQIPDSLLQQLAIGGRLIGPVGGKQQVLKLVERTGKDKWVRSELEGCYFVPLCPGII